MQNTVPCNIDAMLQYFGMKFEGNPHSGLDDSQNISRICLQLLKDGALLDQNERIISLKKTTAFGKNVCVLSFIRLTNFLKKRYAIKC